MTVSVAALSVLRSARGRPAVYRRGVGNTDFDIPEGSFGRPEQRDRTVRSTRVGGAIRNLCCRFVTEIFEI